MKKILYDAANQPLGRAASEAAKILLGKNEVDFAPNRVFSCELTIRNINKLKISAKKLEQKEYFSHSGYIGNLRRRRLKELAAADIGKVFYRVVRGMLPANKLRTERLKNLKIEK